MTAPYYGVRNPGALTAASPGDTLYFFYGTYNDSGNSEADTGFAASDIEVYKDNGTTPRLTDSGYTVINDTGTPGLRRFRIQLFNTADDASFYASGSWYQVAVDSVLIDGKRVRFWAGSFEIGTPRANVVQIGADTGAANQLRAAFANGFNDTGITNRFDRVQAEVDTGLRVHIDDSDTGLKDVIADLDTGLRDFITDAKNELDTGGVNVTATVDTGVVNQAVWQANAVRGITAITDTGLYDTLSDYDTGTKQRLGQIQSDVDTGLRVHIDDLDTGLHAHISDVDTGLHAVLALQDTGAVATAVWAGDTGLRDHITNVDTGLTNRLGIIGFDVDTGLRAHISDLDTGLHDTLADYDTGVRALIAAGVTVTGFSDTGVNSRLTAIQNKTGSLTFTVAGQVDANIQSVNDVTVTGSGTSGDPWGP